MRRDDWLRGVIRGGGLYSDARLEMVGEAALLHLGKPLYVVPDPTHDPPRRLLVTDDEGNVLFLTGLGDGETEQMATHVAQRLGGWLLGAVKRLQAENESF